MSFCNVCELFLFTNPIQRVILVLESRGENMERCINERFKELRLACNKNQEEWGNILGITRPGVSDIESGRRNVTDKHIKLLCVEPINGKYISEEYLRNGTGSKFKELPKEDEVAAYISELLDDGGENPLYDIIKEIMHTYVELSPKSQEVLKDASAKLIENFAKRKED